jgi:hypothetical protein
MAAATGLTVIKSFTYLMQAEEYSNQYWFTGDVPADATEWRALFDALVAQEKTLYPSGVTVVGGYGYDSDAGDAVAVWSVDLTVSPETPVAGTQVVTSGYPSPGDSAVWVRWKTSRLNTKGKAIYLRKYFHPAFNQGVGHPDEPIAVATTALNAFGTKLRDASFIDARTITARGHTDTIVNSGSCQYITTRTLHRRGKRPTG